MRTVDSSHRWNLGTMECQACGCHTQSDIALGPCTKAPGFGAPVKRTPAPKVPDLHRASIDLDTPPRKL